MRARGMAVVAGLFAAFLIFPARAAAHGLGWSVAPGPAVVVRFVYSDGQPMMYGEVSVTAPGGEYEHQKGRSDENGCFAFTPDSAGLWTLAANDGQGHAVRAEVPVDAAAFGAPSSSPASSPVRGIAEAGGSGRPGWLRIAMGLSVFLNIALFGLWRNAKKIEGKTSPGE